MLRIANAASFPNDQPGAASEIAQSFDVDFLSFTYLSGELLGELALARHADHSSGFVKQFTDAIRGLCTALFLQPQLKLFTTAGGVNPLSCAECIAEVLCQHGCQDLRVAVVGGNDILDRLEELRLAGCALDNVEEGLPFDELNCPILAAQARGGAAGFVSALQQDARVMIGGQIGPEAATLAPAIYELGLQLDDWDGLAAIAAAGLVLAAGTTVTWDDADPPSLRPPRPVAEVAADMRPIISLFPSDVGKIPVEVVRRVLTGSGHNGGSIARELADVTIEYSIDNLTVGSRQSFVVEGTRGRQPVDYIEATIWYRRGYAAEALLWIPADDVDQKMEEASDLIPRRMESDGQHGAKSSYRKLGGQVVQWKAVADRRDVTEAFAREIKRIPHYGPRGIYLIGNSDLRSQPQICGWPTRIPKQFIETSVRCRTAQEWT